MPLRMFTTSISHDAVEPNSVVVVPMRPYGSFSEFYQFIGRGIRVLTHPALEGRVGPSQQFLDVVFHGEFAPHIAAIRDDLPELSVLIQIADDSGYSAREMFRLLNRCYLKLGEPTRLGALLKAARLGLV